MNDPVPLIDRYIRQWNESDDTARRTQVEAIWSKDGMTCHRRQLWRGWTEIEQRVGSAYQQWVAEGKSLFCRTDAITRCGPALRFVWHLVDHATGDVRSAGCNYLILDPDDRVRSDYQFAEPLPPTTPLLATFMERYLEVWNATNAKDRETAVRSLWVKSGCHRTDTYQLEGHADIIAEAHRTYDRYGRRGLKFELSGPVDAHHQAARFDWRLAPGDEGDTLVEGSGLLILNDRGCIEVDYQFDPFARDQPTQN